ncbi:hypothetical protein V6Z11_A07G072800 [Gossypium hirsutum]|uniref:Protease Do-like 9 isoform X2 n=1 Tax=Gossypium hirsutum TaxID=3635 RepID=A0ABM3C287_GOSHI|nr:protease Do-like 9 isoform X2 [Gossypium hirsutum]
MDAVVKVFCIHTEPNFSMPWQRKRQYSSSSSGFVISGRRVLTNAHSVEHYTQVKVKKRFGLCGEAAMLTVNNDVFWEGVSPVEFGELPALQDAVTVAGYPIGGDTISVTSRVVSRIEILSCIHGSTELLGLKIDAAINFGNSGGPAFNDKGHCVGITFQSLRQDEAENIGYVIPTPVIQHFIQDYEKNGAYTGFPILGIEWQKMENPDLRKAMGMKPEQKSVRIRRVDAAAPESGVLKSSDIVLGFDGVDIANDGTRFVFTTVSVPYLRSEYGDNYEYEAPMNLLDKLFHATPQSPDEQLVVVSQVFALNGKPVTNIRRLAEMVENCDDEFLKLDLEYEQTVVLRTKTAKATTPDILATHCIPSAMSADLKALRPWT